MSDDHDDETIARPIDPTLHTITQRLQRLWVVDKESIDLKHSTKYVVIFEEFS
jgi:hypothetical protein